MAFKTEFSTWRTPSHSPNQFEKKQFWRATKLRLTSNMAKQKTKNEHAKSGTDIKLTHLEVLLTEIFLPMCILMILTSPEPSRASCFASVFLEGPLPCLKLFLEKH